MAERKTRRRAGTAGGGSPPSDPASDALAALVPQLGTVIGYKLRLAQLSVFQEFLHAFARVRLRPAEFSVLVLIAERAGRKQTEIAGKLGIKRANFVALMDGLERRGLAERRRTGADRRSYSLHLTAAGTRFVRRMMSIWEKHESTLVERLGGAAEKQRLIELLDRILGQSDKR
jgi:DNA-binding MarR family transcriptional regulator